MNVNDVLNNSEWSEWDLSLHVDEEQIKRQNKASDKDISPISIETNSGIFRGSKIDYTTTLSNCTCRDFAVRRKPCKHMYRLANELNLFKLENVLSNSKIESKKRIDEIMPVIESMTDEQQLQFKNIAYVCGNKGDSDGYILNDVDNANKFFELNLIQSVIDKRKLLSFIKFNEIRKLITIKDVKLPRKKIELIEFILTNYPDIELPFRNDGVHIELHYSIQHLGFSIHKRLCAKYPDESNYTFF